MHCISVLANDSKFDRIAEQLWLKEIAGGGILIDSHVNRAR
jgi:hypothetical protein